MAPLQKRALLSFIVGLILTFALVAVLVIQGSVTALESSLNLRLVMYAAMVGVPLSFLILVHLTLRKPTQVDERDRRILERSSWVQWLAAIFTLVVWNITLTENYHDMGQVPVVFINLIFVSTLIIGTLAQSFGILIGYWRGVSRD